MKVVNMPYKHIIVTEKNYRELKGLGSAGDSFNDVITTILEKLKGLQQSTGVPAPKIVVNSEQSSKENCHE